MQSNVGVYVAKLDNISLITEKRAPGWVHLAAGGLGGTIGATLTCPLEVVKTRLQSSAYSQYTYGGSGIFSAKPALQCLKEMISNEGFRSLWKGIVPNLVGVIPSRAIYFWSYSTFKNWYTEHAGNVIFFSCFLKIVFLRFIY